MEEYIKILEELVYNINRVNEHTLDYEVKQWSKEKQAIENLIKGYRKLQETADKLLGQNEWYKDYYDCESIPKSKVKEKIEELSKIKGDFATYIATSERIKVLQELMEDK